MLPLTKKMVSCRIINHRTSSFRNQYRQSRSPSLSISRSVSLRVEWVKCLLSPLLDSGTLTRWDPHWVSFLKKIIHTEIILVLSAAVRTQACTLKVRRLLTQAVRNFHDVSKKQNSSAFSKGMPFNITNELLSITTSGALNDIFFRWVQKVKSLKFFILLFECDRSR